MYCLIIVRKAWFCPQIVRFEVPMFDLQQLQYLRDYNLNSQLSTYSHKYMAVIVDHDRRRVIWLHQGHEQKLFDLFFRTLTPEQREFHQVATGDGHSGSTNAYSAGVPRPNASSTGSASCSGRQMCSTKSELLHGERLRRRALPASGSEGTRSKGLGGRC